MRGFSLVESALSIGVLSFGFLALAPLLALGLTSAQIAATLIEQAKQGTLATGTIYLDSGSNPCASNQAAYAVLGTSTPLSAGTTRLALRVTPVGAPGSARIYADVFPTPPTP